jgi:phenylacetate-CoA ligase
VKSADPELQAATGWSLRTILVAGEPGGSVPEVRARIQALWPGVNVFDHHGLTEIGPVTYQDPKNPGRLIVLEEYYLAEVIDPASGREVLPGEEGELVLTNLRRLGGPLLRYKTGDIVCKGYTRTARLCLKGGVLGRYDDMVVIRGVNVFPSAVDAVVRKFPEVLEYQVREERRGAMLDLHVLAEAAAAQHPGQAAAVRKKMEDALRDAFSLRIPVTIMRPQSLPRFEFKARRWIKEVARPGGGEGGG